MDTKEILAIGSDITTVGLLTTAIFGGYRGWYMWRWVYDDQLKERERRETALAVERDSWKDVALRSLSRLEQSEKI